MLETAPQQRGRRVQLLVERPSDDGGGARPSGHRQEVNEIETLQVHVESASGFSPRDREVNARNSVQAAHLGGETWKAALEVHGVGLEDRPRGGVVQVGRRLGCESEPVGVQHRTQPTGYLRLEVGSLH